MLKRCIQSIVNRILDDMLVSKNAQRCRSISCNQNSKIGGRLPPLCQSGDLIPKNCMIYHHISDYN